MLQGSGQAPKVAPAIEATLAQELAAIDRFTSRLARWLMGGVADKVVRGATVPVLLHRPYGSAEQA